MVRRRRRDFVIHLVHRLAIPAQGLRGERHVDMQGIADRLAHVQCFEQGQLFGMLLDQVGEADQHGLAVRRRLA
ncbi:hypothetical protein D3C71_1684130 [compost metagenome]